jgi:hypothetical protein
MLPNLDRRRFLSFLGAGIAGLALDQAIPFGRVWSFPKEIVIAQPVWRTDLAPWDMLAARMPIMYDAYCGLPPG